MFFLSLFRKKAEKIGSFVKVTLVITGMHGVDEYEIINSGEEAELSRYYTADPGYTDRILCGKITLDPQAITDLMNCCGVPGWDGFRGEHPPDVMDGYRFNFEASLGERTIEAQGSQNFPEGFHKFVRELDGLLERGET